MQKNLPKLPWMEIGRPKSFDDLILSAENHDTLKNCIKDVDRMPNLLFYGPPGTGKTSTARIIANIVLTKETDFNFLELNASTDNGVDVIRNVIKKFVSNTSFLKLDGSNAPYKVVLFDEADMLTKEAQQALRNLMQTYSKNCRFIFCCNNVAQITPAIQSRTLKLHFKPLTDDQIYERVRDVLRRNDYTVDDQFLIKACTHSKGDFRTVYNSLNMNSMQASLTDKTYQFSKFFSETSLKLTMDEVYEIFTSKKVFIEQNYKSILEQLLRLSCLKLEFRDSKDVLSFIDRVAKSEFAINLSNTSPYIQIVGLYAYYRQLV